MRPIRAEELLCDGWVTIDVERPIGLASACIAWKRCLANGLRQIVVLGPSGSIRAEIRGKSQAGSVAAGRRSLGRHWMFAGRSG
jgi:hypothetical protein